MPFGLPLESTLLIALGVVFAAALGFFIGRKTGDPATRIRELQGQLDSANATGEQLREEMEKYRGQVTDHFATTSERLRDLTLQYRSVYDHLARGAVELCPDAFDQLLGGIGIDSLPAAADAEAGEAAAEDSRNDEATELREPSASR